jgi:hypothetical protein
MKQRVVILLLATMLASPALLKSVTVGEVDTFTGGLEGWGVPGAHPSPPQVIANGGSGGLNDAYLQVVALGGNGPGSRLSVQNFGQWAGDYFAAGISAIVMDVNNFGPEDLYLRLLFANLSNLPASVDAAISADGVLVPSGSGWVRAIFPVAPSALLAMPGSISSALSNATELRIFHNPAPFFGGPGTGAPSVIATLGIDNITAVPEPSAAWFVAGGLAVLGLWRLQPLLLHGGPVGAQRLAPSAARERERRPWSRS